MGTDPRLIQFDHAQELRFGGTNDLENFRALITKHHLEKTIEGHKQAAKMKRIEARDGLRLPRMTARDKALAKVLEARNS